MGCVTVILASAFAWPSAQRVLCHGFSREDACHRIRGLGRKSGMTSSRHPWSRLQRPFPDEGALVGSGVDVVLGASTQPPSTVLLPAHCTPA